ncbi:MAG: cytochrome c-type biogenesis protein CcmH [Myxococcales bacterium]|nr:cytochrome c-type biogenesis protein CcmH [Myxococcales bacterium]
MFRRHATQMALALVLVIVSACSGGRDDLATQQHDLEERLLSPCCWRQPLADHESPVATALRAEIRERLARRETAASIEDDLVHRYGEKIRAVPAGGDPRWIIGATAAGASVLALLAIGWFVRRRRIPCSRPLASEPPLDEAYAERLDDELLAID